MKKLLAGILTACLWASCSNAQVTDKVCFPTNAGLTNCQPVTAANPFPVGGGFVPGPAFATLTATGSSASVALPAGTTVTFQNTGTTAVSCTLGVGSATAAPNENIIQPASWFSFSVGANTFGACIDQTGSASNLVVLSGGAGLATGSGGGTSGGGGSAFSVVDEAAFTQGVSSFVPIGGYFITSAASLTSGQSGTALLTAGRALTIDAIAGSSLLTSLNAAVPCLNATAYNTNSYTNAQTNSANCDLHGGLFVNLGSQAGTAGSANASVLTVQGVASMTPLLVTSTPATGTTGAAADPCQVQAQIILPFSITTNTTTNILTGTSAKKIYVCYLYMQTNAANNVAVIEGTTGATCGSSTKALVGGTTAANGLNNAANSGQAMGNGGYSVLQTTVTNNDICIITSAATVLAGVMKYVLQ